MSTKREQVLAALFAVVDGIVGPSVLRNEILPEKIPAAGLIVMRDGTPVIEEAVLSPLSYIILHTVEIECAVQGANGRDASLDTILAALGTALDADRTLGGLADDLRAHMPDTVDEAVPGASGLKSAIVPVIVTYETPDPLM
jgi:hypothetical protein